MGRPVTLTARVSNQAGHTATAAARIILPLLVGMDAPNGAEWATAVKDYSGITYSRDFGSPTTLTALGAGKWVPLPRGAIMHVSWKGDTDQLPAWLKGLDRPVYLTWYHEPMGKVDPATYRAIATRMGQAIAAHPNRRWVLGHGPIVTRYWLDEGKGNPADWAYPGMTHYGIDCYSQDTGSYWPAARMFGTAFAKVRAAFPGIRLLVPEYGLVRTTGDTSGAGRAQAIREHIGWLRRQDDLEAVAYFNSSVFPQFVLSPTSPEAQAWRDMQAL
ncbi:hypothetical protein ABZ671_00940 [Micromonospora sp. NPDC006766]|uniref:hypothetical protein n=1 Tax=Micromonospora sp. NPDC006766 TaxID=3154778 RepID=UPI0033C38B77